MASQEEIERIKKEIEDIEKMNSAVFFKTTNKYYGERKPESLFFLIQFFLTVEVGLVGNSLLFYESYLEFVGCWNVEQ